MQLTNRLGLPPLLVDAIRNDSYDSGYKAEFGNRYITATQLVRPPQMNRLLWEHAEELQEDASERIWSLQGQSVHAIIERAAGERAAPDHKALANARSLLADLEALGGGTLYLDDARCAIESLIWQLEQDIAAAKHQERIARGEILAEHRFYAKLAGWTISGQVDLFDTSTGSLTDWKVTSVWSVLGDDMKIDWQVQLSILSWLLHKNGYEVERASIVAILRDWSRTKALYERHGNYPQEPARVLELRPWNLDLIEAWIEHRLGELEADEPRACTDTERWLRSGGYAAKKRGAKRATKLFEFYHEAEEWIAKQADPGKYEIEGREGEYVRCQTYCSVRNWCRQAQGEAQVM